MKPSGICWSPIGPVSPSEFITVPTSAPHAYLLDLHFSQLLEGSAVAVPHGTWSRQTCWGILLSTVGKAVCAARAACEERAPKARCGAGGLGGTKGREPPRSTGHDGLRCRLRHGKQAWPVRRFAGGNTNDPAPAGATFSASLQSTCGKEFISSRRLRRTRLPRTRFRFSPSPDEKGRIIGRR